MPYKHGVTGSSPVVPTKNMALWCSRLARQPVTLEVDGSSPFGVAKGNTIPTGMVLLFYKERFCFRV